MADSTETIRRADGQPLTVGRSVGIALGQLVLVPVLFFFGFAFFFVGMGASPDSTAAMLTVRDGVLIALYGTVFLTVLMLPVGALTLLVARKSRVGRWAAYLPLGFAGASVVILTGLGIAGMVFDQLAGI